MQTNLTGLLLIIFVILKLTHVIHWSWVWVLSPLWIPLLIWGAITIFALLMALIINRSK